ncbi:LysR family transcriptional regulator [Conexibacter sp. CPCC 206217]|uniref:LysR family transcriptional regulator n=1 Tax=Conexibacter sp. CPCC 206217 TaxID=3064574 RepID=UPI002728F891|nr:LysR family transcriptional regulator [Conexibacter sp. CPCC 206217]MDO8209680.1 LysR family transcriptional regulator [Conexibacter sp. CPCC 206217]
MATPIRAVTTAPGADTAAQDRAASDRASDSATPDRAASDSATPDRAAPFEPRHLAALVAVAKTGSFRVAGTQLGYVQSAVSRQIATLEEAAGTRLVERARGGNEVHLTQAGEVLLTHAEALLARQTAARADLQQLAQGETGAVRVGVLQGVGHRVLRSALAVYRQRRPGARVEASEYPADAPLFELVEQGRLDLGLAGMPLPDGPFARRNLLRVRWVLAMPAHWRIPRHDGVVRLPDLAGQPLIGRHDERTGPSLEGQLRAAGTEPNVVFRTDIDETMRGLVAAGVGAALLPRVSVHERDATIAVAPLEDVALTQVVGLFWHRERLLSAAAVELRGIVSEVCGRIEPGEAGDDGAAEAAA